MKYMLFVLLLTLNVQTFALFNKSIVGSANLENSGDATELEWAEDTLNTKLKIAIKSTDVKNINETFNETFDYYIVKTGKMKFTLDTHYLIENFNNDPYDYDAMVEIMSATGSSFNTGKISHVVGLKLLNETQRFPAKVVEPSSLALLGLGILGFLLVNRKRNKII